LQEALKKFREEEVRKRLRKQYPVPTILLLTATAFLLISIFFPYWIMEMDAPQYPDGLRVEVFVNKIIGDVEELDLLNHYIGMRTLNEGATIERNLSVFAIVALCLSTTAAVFVHNRWAVFLALPVLVYPFIFLLDLFLWLRFFGQNLDSSAPLSSAIEPFTPPLIGNKAIANFIVHTNVGSGFYIACIAVVLVTFGIFFHRKFYKNPIIKIANAEIEGSDPVTIGATYDIIPHIILEVAKSFRQINPSVGLNIKSGHRSDVLQMVKKSEVDVGILPGVEKSNDVNFNSLFKYERVLITPLNHPLLKQPMITLKDIVQYPLILMEEHSYTRQLIEKQFKEHNLDYNIAIELDSMDFIKQFVAIGMGISIGPLLAIEKEDLKKVNVVNISNILVPDEAGFITNPKKELTNNSLSFIEALEAGSAYK